MAEGVVKAVLGNLSSLAGTEMGTLLGFDREKEKLESMFSFIKATLQDAEEKQFSDKAIKDWLGKLKDAAYELEDILDECAYEELRLEREEVKCCVSEMVLSSPISSFHPMHLLFRYKIAKRMESISKRLDEIGKEKVHLGLISTVQDTTGGFPQSGQTFSSITEPLVYGRADDKKKIVDFLIGYDNASQHEDLLVYPILGLGGLGKTTLVKLICTHEKVTNHFEQIIWVCVSEDFSLKRMMKAIIEAASNQICQDVDLEPLHTSLQDLLQSKRYLLVLDDVWEHEQDNWQKLKSVLACGAKGSSILVTTRLLKVAAIMGTIPPHELSALSDSDSWKLFKHHAFDSNEVEQVEFEDIGKEIVKKCGGVPLAAKALGGLLRFKRNKNQWFHVSESNFLKLADKENSIIPVLRLSYLHLPIELRQCFAYCAIFPKDEIIEKQYLIELWMANGFISSNGMLDAEDVGDDVWNELYWRSFFQDIQRDEFGKVTSFKMHDLVYDLAQSIAENVCCIRNDKDTSVLSKRTHHLFDERWIWSSSSKDHSIQWHQVKSLRTCILPNYVDDQLSSQLLKCYSLRVIEFVSVYKLPSSIGDLKHLRYLNLSRGSFETLPESLSKLWNLQILKLDGCQRLRQLPNSLICLKDLQQLSLKDCDNLSSLPRQIGKLTSLRILSNYIVGKEGGFFLAELRSLKLKGDLDIRHMERVKSVKDAKEANMSSKQLNNLLLSWDENEEEWELQENVEEILQVLEPGTQQLRSLDLRGYNGAYFPQWMASPSLKYLLDLELQDCKRCLQLPALYKLPSLKRLKIHSMTEVRYLYEECYDGGEGFKALEYLSLKQLPNLLRLSREDGKNMFPSLFALDIYDCPKLLAEEELVQGLCSLKELYVSGCDKFNVSAGFQCITSLEYLTIDNCRELREVEGLQQMTSLKELTLINLPHLQSFPDCFGNLPWLHELKLWDLPKLESCPDCFANLPMLHLLNIWNCSKLTSLPSSLSLSNLETLKILDCPQLEKRCEKETGEDWSKIAHIPDINIQRN